MNLKDLNKLLEATEDDLIGSINAISNAVKIDPHYSRQELFTRARRGDKSILSHPDVNKFTNKFNETPIDILADKLGVNPFTLLDEIERIKSTPKTTKPKVEID